MPLKDESEIRDTICDCGLAAQREAVRDGWLQGRYHSGDGETVAEMLSFNSVFEINPFEVGTDHAAERRVYADGKTESLDVPEESGFTGEEPEVTIITPTPAPTPEPGTAVVETTAGLPSMEETAVPTATVSLTPPPVPTITPNMKGYHNLGQGDRGEEVKKLQALGLVGVEAGLQTTVTDGLLEVVPSLSLLLFEESGKDIVALGDGILTEVLAQHGSHQFHLRVHGLAVGLDDIGGQDEKGKEETVAVALCLSLPVDLVVGVVAIVASGAVTKSSGIVRVVD